MSFTILGPISEGGTKLPFCSFRVPAGFPSPAADHIEQHISLDEVLNIRALHVYLIAITGESMQGAGIFEGDLAVVDRSIEPSHGHIVVALLNNDPICKRLCKRGK
ncbi:protein UmuD [Pseudomonas sp. FH4]|nr:protein UmuD [Pseudomonas sp. FH4]